MSTLPVQQLSIVEILKKTFFFYKDYGLQFTKPLIRPIGFKLLGMFLWLLLAFKMILVFPAGIINVINNQAIVILIAMTSVLISALPGMYFFFKGFWEYILYWTSLSQNVVEVVQGTSPDFERAKGPLIENQKTYVYMLLLLASLWVPSIFIMAFVTPLCMQVNWILGGLSVLFNAFLLLVCCVLSIYFCVSFQAFILDETTRSKPTDAIKASLKLVENNFFRALAMTIVIGVVAGTVIPRIVQLALSLLQVNQLLALPISLITGDLYAIGNSLNDEAISGVFAALEAMGFGSWELAVELGGTVISAAASFLILPLGTFAYSLLYLDLRARQESI